MANGRVRLSAQDQEVFLKYAPLALPRHTSYPIVPKWNQNPFDPWASKSASAGFQLYIHVPYCHKLCYYCGCNKEICNLKEQDDPRPAYLQALYQELRSIIKAFDGQPPPLEGVHFGGGTPTFLTPLQLMDIGAFLREHFAVVPSGEWAMELDPRSTSRDHLEALDAMGINRVSVGVQDFSPKVQEAVNRCQSYELVSQFVEDLRSYQLGAINFDLIYGLPYQTMASIEETLAKVVSLKPSRIAFYRLAVIPHMFKWQRSFTKKDMPASLDAAEMMLRAVEFLGAYGYAFIGLDHFALEDDPLAQAFASGQICRNFQGMATKESSIILGVGPTAISSTPEGFFQRTKDIKKWAQAASQKLNTIEGWHRFTAEDRLRSALLQDLYSFGRLDLARHLEDPSQWSQKFNPEMAALEQLKQEGVLDLKGSEIRLTFPLGRLLVRPVAAVFDSYLPRQAWKKGLSSLSQVG